MMRRGPSQNQESFSAESAELLSAGSAELLSSHPAKRLQHRMFPVGVGLGSQSCPIRVESEVIPVSLEPVPGSNQVIKGFALPEIPLTPQIPIDASRRNASDG